MEYCGYEIINDGTYGMKFIKTIGRGSLPKVLRGKFSTHREAMKAIDVAITARKASNGEGNTTSRD